MRLRFWPVFLRNFLVWRKLIIPSLIANIAEPLMWLVAFGYGLGALVGEVSLDGQQVPYIIFLASGSVCMSAMNAATFEALYSAFSRMHVQKTWDGIMNAPVRFVCDVGFGHCAILESAAGLAHLAGGGHHLQLSGIDIQCLGQRLRFLHLLLHAVFNADDVFKRCIFSAGQPA